jgi:hypothetical protein
VALPDAALSARKESGADPQKFLKNSKKVLTLFRVAEYKSAGT